MLLPIPAESRAQHVLDCEFCKLAEEATLMGDTLTEDDVKAQVAKAVADAVAPLQAQLTERETKITDLESKLGERDANEATTTAVADAVEPLNAKITELTADLDAAKLAQGAAENESKALKDWFQALADVEIAKTRREDRIAAAKETGVWPEDVFDEKVQANVDRIDGWVAMDDVVFDVLIEGWKAAGPRKPDAGDGNGKIPTKRSAMVDAVTDGADETKGGGKSGVGGFLSSRISGLATASTDS
jgi:hypothetical protein